MSGVPGLHAMGNACRHLLSRPGHSLLSITVLGVGLGTVLFLFSLVHALILQPLPFPHADRLVAIGHAHEDGVGIGSMATDEYMLLAPKLHTVDTVGAYEQVGVNLARDQAAVHYDGTLMTASMFDLLGVKPVFGRVFTADDDRPGAALTVMIGARLWSNDFNSDPDIVGKSVRINGEWAKVIGVLPGDFAFPVDSQVWLPKRTRLDDDSDVEMVARLKPSTGLHEARSELRTVTAALGDQLSVQRHGRHIALKPLAFSFVNETTRSYVWIMFFAGALVLLLACANAANLQLVQTLNRERELAVRSALGATRGRLLAGQLAESLVLSLLAALLALGITQAGNRWLESVYVANGRTPHYFIHLGVDLGVIVFAIAAALLTTLLSGLMPALRASRTDVQQSLRDGGKGSRGGFVHVAKLLVVAEIMLTVVLLVGAGTFLHGLVRLLSAPNGAGADPSHVLVAHLDPFPQDYPDAMARERFFDDVVERLRRTSGVVDATVSDTVPGALLGSHEYAAAQGQARPQEGWTRIQQGIVDRQFADTFGLRLLKGRFFQESDRADTLPVTVIDQKLASRLWPDRDAIGQHLMLHPEQEHPLMLTIVGVVAPLMLDTAVDDPLPSILRPRAQVSVGDAVVSVRTRAAAAAFTPGLLSAIRTIDPQAPVYEVRSQEQAIAKGRISAVVLTQVFSAVGMVALILAGAGLYGVLAFSVTQRTREIGIQRAIGARNGTIVNQVGRQILLQVVLGLGFGVALAVPWSKLLSDPKLHTQGHEAIVFFPVVAIILGVALIATAAPLWRALRVDPVVALRYD